MISANGDSVKKRANITQKCGRHHVGSTRESTHAAGAAAAAVTATETVGHSQRYWYGTQIIAGRNCRTRVVVGVVEEVCCVKRGGSGAVDK